MLEQLANAITFYAFYVASSIGKTGLTVTIDVYEATNGTPIVSAGNATELGGGLYYYTLASGSVDNVGEYVAIFKTADTSVDQKQLPAIWTVGRAGVEDLDAAISSRLAPTVAGRTLDVTATGAAGIDWGNVEGLATVNDLSGTTVKHVTDAVTAGTVSDKTGYSLAAGAITATEAPALANLDVAVSSRASATDYTALRAAKLDNLDGTISGIPAAVWGYVNRSLTSFGTLIADIWAYVQRTLTSFGFTVNTTQLGPGAIEWLYTLVDGDGDPVADADIWVTTDLAGSNVIASSTTDQYGVAKFYLDEGTVYVWGQKTGYVFNNPDTEEVTA